MRLWIFSCLQLDHPRSVAFPPEGLFPDADVAVIAGDIHRPLTRSIETLAPIAARMRVVCVAGNRDYYSPLPMKEEEDAASALARTLKIDLLHDSEVVIDGVRFLGSTLWTDYALLGDPAAGMAAAARGISDHHVIQESAGIRFTPEAARERHRASRRYIATALASPHRGPTVVVSHHSPHPDSISSIHAGQPTNPSFSSDLTPLLQGTGAPDLWVHGAHHQNFDYAVGGTRVISNSRGYPGENPAFDPALTVDLHHRP